LVLIYVSIKNFLGTTKFGGTAPECTPWLWTCPKVVPAIFRMVHLWVDHFQWLPTFAGFFCQIFISQECRGAVLKALAVAVSSIDLQEWSTPHAMAKWCQVESLDNSRKAW